MVPYRKYHFCTLFQGRWLILRDSYKNELSQNAEENEIETINLHLTISSFGKVWLSTTFSPGICVLEEVRKYFSNIDNISILKNKLKLKLFIQPNKIG